MPFSRIDICRRFPTSTGYLLIGAIALTLYGFSAPTLCKVGHSRSCKPAAQEMKVTSKSQVRNCHSFDSSLVVFGVHLSKFEGWVSLLLAFQAAVREYLCHDDGRHVEVDENDLCSLSFLVTDLRKDSGGGSYVSETA